MKRILSVVLTAALVLMNTAVFADNASAGEMKEALIKVKEKIEIPAELAVFESTSEVMDDEMHFSFTWRNGDDYSRSIRVGTDQYGNISEYNYYDESIYMDRAKTADASKEDYFKAAEEFMEKIVPQLFEAESNRLVPVGDDGAIRNDFCSFRWERQKDGVPVPSNGAYATVTYTNNGFVVTDASITWEYATEFTEDYDNVIENPEDKYFEQYPLELVYMPDRNVVPYRINGDEKPPRLIYRFKDSNAGCILAATGEKAEEDDVFSYYGNEKEAAMADSGDLRAAGAAVLTEAELTELENVSGLLTAAQIVKKANDAGVFGKLPDASEFSSSVYGKDGRYYIRLFYSADSRYINIQADGKTGRIINIFNYDYSKDYDPEKTYSDKEYEAAKASINKFLDKNYAEEISVCTEPEETADSYVEISMVRTVNGVKYLRDGISVSYDMERGVISRFSLDWTDDTSKFPAPSQAISEEKAREIILENAPVELCYVKIDNMFTLCFKAKDSIQIDAVKGEPVVYYPSYAVPVYTDISGHWAENQIKSVAEHGAGLPGTEFKPDTDITQFDLLRMLVSVTSYDCMQADEESFYEDMIRQNIVTSEEKNPQAPVSREDAFAYLIRLMGFSKIASMNDIFMTGFADGSDISADKIGSIAILRGYGIVKGDGASIRPKDNITRAEAAALGYAYMTAEK